MEWYRASKMNKDFKNEATSPSNRCIIVALCGFHVFPHLTCVVRSVSLSNFMANNKYFQACFIASYYYATKLYGDMDTYFTFSCFLLLVCCGFQTLTLFMKKLEEKLEYIKSVTTGAYINFPYAELEDYEKEYYGENIERLKAVKIKYDPYEVFNFPQGIRVSHTYKKTNLQ